MNIWMKRCLEAGVIAGGLWLLGTGLASAQDLGHGSRIPAHAVLSAPVTAPITIGGNAVSVLSGRHASTATMATTSGSTGAVLDTSAVADQRSGHRAGDGVRQRRRPARQRLGKLQTPVRGGSTGS